jgi:folate-dependent phosphoribosylglycinamide formyltransferase PurN
MATDADPFRVVFLSSSAYSTLAADIMKLLEGQGPYRFYAVVNRVTVGRLRQVGIGAVLRKGFSILRSRLRPRRPAAPTGQASTAARVQVVTVPRIGDATSIETLRSIRPHVCINTGGCGILRKDFLDAAGLGVLNSHSGLPHFRGFNTFEWQLYYGRGLVLHAHMIDTGIDTGPLVARMELPLIANPSVDGVRQAYGSQQARVLAAGIDLLCRQGAACLKPQKPEEGRQYFALHHRLRRLLDARLTRDGASARIAELRDSTRPDQFDRATVVPAVRYW